MSNADYIWRWLWERIGNDYGVAGLMGNLCAESGLNPQNLQNSYEGSLGMNDRQYTEAVDSMDYTREQFISDRAGYGLAQWTYRTRKAKLYDYAKLEEKSIGDLDMQLEFLIDEIAKNYRGVFTTLLEARTVREASDAVMLKYEIPADTSETNRERRAALGQAFYDRFAAEPGAGAAETQQDGETAAEEKIPPEGQEMANTGVLLNYKAQACVDLAESKMGDPYVYGAWGDPCTVKIRKQYAAYNPQYKEKIYGACPVLDGDEPACMFCKWNGHLCYDCRGFTHYVLKTAAGIDIQGAGATSQYDAAVNWEERGDIKQMPNAVCCVFKRVDGKMSHTGLHAGDGMIIHCSTVVKRGAISDTTWTHYAVPKGLYSTDELKEAGKVKMRETLKSGCSGDAVRELQEILKGMGFDPGTVDGKFGQKTKEAVMAFQAAFGLTADGIVGGVTWSEIEKQQNQKKPREAGEQDKVPEDEPRKDQRSWEDLGMQMFRQLAEQLGYTIDARSGNVSRIDYQ